MNKYRNKNKLTKQARHKGSTQHQGGGGGGGGDPLINNRRITQLFKSNLYAIKNLVVVSCCQLSKGRVETVKEIQVS